MIGRFPAIVPGRRREPHLQSGHLCGQRPHARDSELREVPATDQAIRPDQSRSLQ